MTPEERSLKMEELNNSHSELIEALGQFPREMWKFKSVPVAWSIHEIVNHLADADLFLSQRSRQCIAEPGTTVGVYDQDVWVDRLFCDTLNTDNALALIGAARRSLWELFGLLPAEVWAHTVHHPESGILGLEELLDYLVEHVRIHINQMRRNFDIWQKENRS
ncbi:DinB family protein [candidate division KSB1 bacterium]